MESTQKKAEVLFDFTAESPGELSVSQNEIIILVQMPVDNPWWTAMNASGQVGAVPHNYIRVIDDEQQQTLSASTMQDTTYQDSTANQQEFFDQSTAQMPNYQPSNDQESAQQIKTVSTDSYTTESIAQPFISTTIANNQDRTAYTMFDSSVPLATTDYSTNFLSDTSVSAESYSHLQAAFLAQNSSRNLTSAFEQDQSRTVYLPDLWHQNQSIPSLTSPIASPDPRSLSQFSYSPSEQQFPSFNNSTFAPLQSTSSNLYTTQVNLHNEYSSMATPSYENNTTRAIAEDPSPKSPIVQPPHEATTEPIPVTTETTKVNQKKKFFTLKRQKPPREGDDRLSLNEASLNSMLGKSDNDKDKNSSNTTLPEEPNASSNANKPTAAEPDGKGANPRARFFDKYGLDNYIIRDIKTKINEQINIDFNRTEGRVYWSPDPAIPPFTCKIEDPSKGTKLAGFKSFIEYKIQRQVPGSRGVSRRYKQFDWLYEQLVSKFRFICVPPLPGKQIAGRFEEEFVEDRRRQLELWLNRICRHPVLCASYPVQHFMTFEINDQTVKQWKAGKRKIEKDELREAAWLYSVTCQNSTLSDTDIATQIEAFALMHPQLEQQLKNFSQGLVKYLEKQTEVYQRDKERLSELFSKVQSVLQLDTTTTGNNKLSESTAQVSNVYHVIADIYKEESTRSIRNFIERIQEYCGMLTCFPTILSLHRSASDFIRTLQQRNASSSGELSGPMRRFQVLNHVVLAEINYFQRTRVEDLNLYFKTFVQEQMLFYENITDKLHGVARNFT